MSGRRRSPRETVSENENSEAAMNDDTSGHPNNPEPPAPAFISVVPRSLSRTFSSSSTLPIQSIAAAGQARQPGQTQGTLGLNNVVVAPLSSIAKTPSLPYANIVVAKPTPPSLRDLASFGSASGLRPVSGSADRASNDDRPASPAVESCVTIPAAKPKQPQGSPQQSRKTYATRARTSTQSKHSDDHAQDTGVDTNPINPIDAIARGLINSHTDRATGVTISKAAPIGAAFSALMNNLQIVASFHSASNTGELAARLGPAVSHDENTQSTTTDPSDHMTSLTVRLQELANGKNLAAEQQAAAKQPASSQSLVSDQDDEAEAQAQTSRHKRQRQASGIQSEDQHEVPPQPVSTLSDPKRIDDVLAEALSTAISPAILGQEHAQSMQRIFDDNEHAPTPMDGSGPHSATAAPLGSLSRMKIEAPPLNWSLYSGLQFKFATADELEHSKLDKLLHRVVESLNHFSALDDDAMGTNSHDRHSDTVLQLRKRLQWATTYYAFPNEVLDTVHPIMVAYRQALSSYEPVIAGPVQGWEVDAEEGANTSASQRINRTGSVGKGFGAGSRAWNEAQNLKAIKARHNANSPPELSGKLGGLTWIEQQAMVLMANRWRQWQTSFRQLFQAWCGVGCSLNTEGEEHSESDEVNISFRCASNGCKCIPYFYVCTPDATILFAPYLRHGKANDQGVLAMPTAFISRSTPKLRKQLATAGVPFTMPLSRARYLAHTGDSENVDIADITLAEGKHVKQSRSKSASKRVRRSSGSSVSSASAVQEASDSTNHYEPTSTIGEKRKASDRSEEQMQPRNANDPELAKAMAASYESRMRKLEASEADSPESALIVAGASAVIALADWLHASLPTSHFLPQTRYALQQVYGADMQAARTALVQSMGVTDPATTTDALDLTESRGVSVHYQHFLELLHFRALASLENSMDLRSVRSGAVDVPLLLSPESFEGAFKRRNVLRIRAEPHEASRSDMSIAKLPLQERLRRGTTLTQSTGYIEVQMLGDILPHAAAALFHLLADAVPEAHASCSYLVPTTCYANNALTSALEHASAQQLQDPSNRLTQQGVQGVFQILAAAAQHESLLASSRLLAESSASSGHFNVCAFAPHLKLVPALRSLPHCKLHVFAQPLVELNVFQRNWALLRKLAKLAERGQLEDEDANPNEQTKDATSEASIAQRLDAMRLQLAGLERGVLTVSQINMTWDTSSEPKFSLTCEIRGKV